jgi:hypothetical protein
MIRNQRTKPIAEDQLKENARREQRKTDMAIFIAQCTPDERLMLLHSVAALHVYKEPRGRRKETFDVPAAFRTLDTVFCALNECPLKHLPEIFATRTCT